MQSASRPYRSLYTYAWDIQDIGVTRFVDELLALGITDVSLATSYHAGKFLRPHAKHGPRVIFPEDGVVYFNPDYGRYGKILPRTHSDPQMRAVLPDLLADGRLRVHGWTVLMHNSRIGANHPEYTSKNVFGDSYVYSLCPMNGAVFDYAVALSQDLTQRYSLNSLILETPGWLPYAHGYHHEFAQVAPDRWLDTMLGFCFCDACKHAAEKQDIAFTAVKEKVKQRIAEYLNNPVFLTAEQAEDKVREYLHTIEGLSALVEMRCQRVTQLVSAIRKEMPASTLLTVIPTVQRPTSACWLEGSDLAALASVADGLEVPFYESDAATAIKDARETLQAAGHYPQKIRAILRPGFPDLSHGAELGEAMQGIKALGIKDFAFYNYGLLPRSRLQDLGAVLAQQDAHEESKDAS